MNDDRERRGSVFALLTTLFFALSCDGVQAGDTLVPPDPWEMIHAVNAVTKGEVGRDDFRDPMISAVAPETLLGYRMIFHGCDFGRNCTSVLLVMRLATPKGYRSPTLANLADWNSTRLIGRAVRDGKGRAALEHPVVLGPGLAPDTLSQTLAAWHAAMVEFAQHVVFAKK